MLVKSLQTDLTCNSFLRVFPPFTLLTDLKRKRTINERSVEDGADKQSQSSRGALPISFTTA